MISRVICYYQLAIGIYIRILMYIYDTHIYNTAGYYFPTQLSLNEGNFQLCLYHSSPNAELDYNINMFDNHRSVILPQ